MKDIAGRIRGPDWPGVRIHRARPLSRGARQLQRGTGSAEERFPPPRSRKRRSTNSIRGLRGLPRESHELDKSQRLDPLTGALRPELCRTAPSAGIGEFFFFKLHPNRGLVFAIWVLAVDCQAFGGQKEAPITKGHPLYKLIIFHPDALLIALSTTFPQLIPPRLPCARTNYFHGIQSELVASCVEDPHTCRTGVFGLITNLAGRSSNSIPSAAGVKVHSKIPYRSTPRIRYMLSEGGRASRSPPL